MSKESNTGIRRDYPWGHERRFNAYSDYFREKFGGRVQKISINAGFTCPNRDGTKGLGGCTFCNNDAFNPSYCHPAKGIKKQMEEGMEFHRTRYRRSGKYLAYFQAFSNTYAPLSVLRPLYQQALEFREVVGLVIGTRPDCVDDEKLDYFRQLARDYYIVIEYGIESCFDETLERVNRGHRFQDTFDAIRATANRGLLAGGHIIFGLPGESRGQMMAEASILSALPLHSLKIHQLQIIRNTPLAEEYARDPSLFRLFTLDEYIDFVIRWMEKLRPEIVVERFSGEAPPRFITGPRWGIRNDQVLGLVEKRMEELDTWQGKLYESVGKI
jgi:radical SAM protein (TIGR01212 family)